VIDDNCSTTTMCGFTYAGVANHCGNLA